MVSAANNRPALTEDKENMFTLDPSWPRTTRLSLTSMARDVAKYVRNKTTGQLRSLLVKPHGRRSRLFHSPEPKARHSDFGKRLTWPKVSDS